MLYYNHIIKKNVSLLNLPPHLTFTATGQYGQYFFLILQKGYNSKKISGYKETFAVMYENCKGMKGEAENGPGGKEEIECTKSKITRGRVSTKQ